MGLLGRCCWRLIQLAVFLFALAFALVAYGVSKEPPPSLLPPPADLSLCESRAPEPKPGPVHIRKSAEFDIVLYGATGFTGKIAAHYLALAPGSFSFAIAGRDWGKLDQLDRDITAKVKEAGHGRESSAILVANSKDTDGLRKIVKKAKVVLTAAGPYFKYGTGLLKTCAQEGTHYADITGEFPWIRKMMEDHESKAGSSGAKIVVSAGYDSVPFDLGAALTLKALDASLGSPAKNVTVRAAVTDVRGGVSGGTLSSGKVTAERLQAGKIPREWMEDPYLLAPTASCKTDAVVDGWGKPRYDATLGVSGVPHMMAGITTRIVRRSLELLGRRGVSYGEGMTFGSLAGGALFALCWSGSMKMDPPPGEGPPLGVQRVGGYKAVFVSRDEASGRTARLDMVGRGDPGYSHTARLLVEVGLCLLNVSCHRAGMGGGIHTPVSALDPDALLERLKAAKHMDGRPLLSVELTAGSVKHGGEL